MLILVEMAGFWAYQSAGKRALAAGWEAHESGECASAIERYEGVSTLQKLTLTSIVASARARKRECEQFLLAQAERNEGEFPAAVTRYRSFLTVHPESVLVARARAELAQTYIDWASESAGKGDYGDAVERYEIVRVEYPDTPAASDVEALLARTLREWKRAYQRQLVIAGKRIQSSIAAIRRLGAVPRLTRWFEGAEKDFSKVQAVLAAVAPPERVANAHDGLEAALDGYPAALADTASAVQEGRLCAAPSVLARLANAGAGRRLRTAERSLQRQGFHLKLSALGSARQTNRTLPTGQFVISGDRSGSNSMRIENQGRFDSVVALTVDSNKPAMSVYVGAGDEYTISGLPDGTYRSYFTTGEDWDRQYRTFTRRCVFLSSGGKLEMTSDASSYTIGTLTLFPDERGGKRAILVDPGDFPGGPR